MKTKTATKVNLYCSLKQIADSRCKHLCRAYAATLSVALVNLSAMDYSMLLCQCEQTSGRG